MLFYHLKLRCYIVIELKATKFRPEHTGQLSFYMAAIDNEYRTEHDSRTIGMILCQKKNKIIAEYALQNSNAPMGVSEYDLAKHLPTEITLELAKQLQWRHGLYSQGYLRQTSYRWQ